MIRLAVRCRPAGAERVLAELLELAPGGIEEGRGDGYVEYAIYGPPGELPALPELEAAAGGSLVVITSTEIADDWADRWRDFHPRVTIGGRLRVHPSWAPPADAGPLDLVLDPGRAFGTGAHATTRLCLELLLELAESEAARGSLADLGTGSGVLAIAAARLGWAPVLGIDHDLAALEAAAENAAANQVELELGRANLREDPLPIVDAIVANLTCPLLLEVATRLDRRGPPRLLICSGLLRSEADRVVEALSAAGLAERERREDGGWVALRLAR